MLEFFRQPISSQRRLPFRNRFCILRIPSRQLGCRFRTGAPLQLSTEINLLNRHGRDSKLQSLGVLAFLSSLTEFLRYRDSISIA
jgi:hypothetical protein